MSEERIETTERLLEVLSKISFENSTLNFRWEFKALPVTVGACRPDWDGLNEIPVWTSNTAGVPDDIRIGWLVWAEFQRPDIRTGQVGTGRGRDEIVWKGTTESGVVKTAWVLFHMMIHHEELEGFRYKGVQIFNPHNTVEELSMPLARAGQAQVDTYNVGGKQ